MADIRSFFGGKPAGEGGKKPAAPAVAAKKEGKPSPIARTVEPTPDEPASADPAPARKRLRRAALADDDDDDAVAVVQNRPAAAAGAASSSCAPERPAARPAAPPARPVELEATPAAGAAGAGDDDASDVDSDAVDPAGPKVAASPLMGKLRQAGDAKAKSKGTLDNMRVAYDAAKAFSLERVGARWKAGEPVPYAFLVGAFDKCAQTTKRLEITHIMADALRAVLELTPADLLPTLYLSLNILGPSFAGIELGLGDALLLKAVAETCGRQEKQLKAELDEEGDLGALAMASRATQRLMFTPARLTVRKVFATYLEIAKLAGKDCMTKKRDKVKQLLVASHDTEAMYVVRGLQGKLRVGLAEQTVLTSLAHALVLSPPAAVGSAPPALKQLGVEGLHGVLAEAEAIVKDVYAQMPSYEAILAHALARPLSTMLEHVHLTAGVPVKPMLAKPTKGIAQVLERFGSGTFTCEFKYDGERAQIHYTPDGACKVFSRNSEDMTGKYPDILARMPAALAPTTKSFIIDCEAVAYDPVADKLLPFQKLSTRAKKDVAAENIVIQVKVFAFDILFLNGQSLIKRSLGERRKALHGAFVPVAGEFDFATAKDSDSAEEIGDFLTDAVAANCEGLMVKTLDVDATYEPTKRSFNWLKVKKDYIDGMGDSLDLVPIGAYHGRGKRTGVFGAFLLACYDEAREEYQSICKIGTGFSEDDLKRWTAFFKEEADGTRLLDGPRAYYRYPKRPDLTPDVWFEPSAVWEVLAADLSISPQYCAAAGEVHESSGIALRFPRFIRERDDKKPEDATNSMQVAQMYREQFEHQKSKRAMLLDEEDEEEDE